MTPLRSRTFEFKLARVDAAGTFSGYASTFGPPADSQGDVIQRGAFARSIAEQAARGAMPALLWCHDMRQPLGKWISVREDPRGLSVSGKLTLEVRQAAEAYALMKDGAVTGLSIGYQTREAIRDRDGVRLLSDVELLEISLVPMPSNPSARVMAVKSARPRSIREFEAALRDAMGFNRAEAKALASHGWPALARRDARVDGMTGLAGDLRKAAATINPQRR